jgi:hypothetical protein
VTARDYRVTADHPVDTDDGRVVEPGGTFTADDSERLRALSEAGLLEVVPERKNESKPKREETS